MSKYKKFNSIIMKLNRKNSNIIEKSPISITSRSLKTLPFRQPTIFVENKYPFPKNGDFGTSPLDFLSEINPQNSPTELNSSSLSKKFLKDLSLPKIKRFEEFSKKIFTLSHKDHLRTEIPLLKRYKSLQNQPAQIFSSEHSIKENFLKRLQLARKRSPDLVQDPSKTIHSKSEKNLTVQKKFYQDNCIWMFPANGSMTSSNYKP